MANEFKIGDITIILPDDLEIPEAAKTAGVDELGRKNQARRGVGLLCMIIADLLERHPDRLRLPAHITPARLRELGARAEAWDSVILNVAELSRLVQKSNTVADGEAHDALGEVNQQLKAQLSSDPTLAADFAALRAYFGAKV